MQSIQIWRWVLSYARILLGLLFIIGWKPAVCWGNVTGGWGACCWTGCVEPNRLNPPRLLVGGCGWFWGWLKLNPPRFWGGGLLGGVEKPNPIKSPPRKLLLAGGGGLLTTGWVCWVGWVGIPKPSKSPPNPPLLEGCWIGWLLPPPISSPKILKGSLLLTGAFWAGGGLV